MPKTELDVKKEKTEEKSQDMGCFLKPSWGDRDKDFSE
jgi:hypothetical protein